VDSVSVLTSPDYTKTSSAPYCNNHRSMYCVDVVNFLESRGDAPGIIHALGDQKGLWLQVPVFPAFCVWEELYYEVNEPSDGFARMPEEVVKLSSRKLAAIRTLLAGESAWDLAGSLRQQFEDDLYEYMTRITMGGTRLNLPWRCKSSIHGLKYQKIIEKALNPNQLSRNFSSGQDLDLMHAMLYTLMRHSHCLFCWVNTHARDAVRVNPELAAIIKLPDSADSENNDFEDMIPR
jgi:hypothetical protein